MLWSAGLIFTSLLALGLAVVIPDSASAQGTSSYDEQAATKGIVQCGNKAADPCTVEDIFNVIVITTNLLIGMAGIIAIISIIYAGFSMVSAAGSQEGITSAKKRLSNSIIGLILVLLAFVIINAILGSTLGIGVFGGDSILSNPKCYISKAGTNPDPTKTPTNTPPVNTQTKPPVNACP